MSRIHCPTSCNASPTPVSPCRTSGGRCSMSGKPRPTSGEVCTASSNNCGMSWNSCPMSSDDYPIQPPETSRQPDPAGVPTSGTRLALVEKTRECDFVEGVIQQIRGRWAAHRPKPTLGWLSELGGNEAISCRSASGWLMSALVTGEERHPTRF